MSSQSAEQWEEAICEALRAVRREFAEALDATSQSGNALTVLATDLRVDQLRSIVSSAGGPVYWAQRDGRRYISTATAVGQIFLGFIVGNKRFMVADDFVENLVDLCLEQPRRFAMEMDIANFINLTVVEAYHHPEHELTIWVTLAHKLATGRGEDDLFRDLPGLMTEYDILYREMPPDALYAENLLPGARPASAESMPRYQARLLASVLPALTEQVSALATNEERAALFAAHEPELREYVRAHVFPRVAAASDASPAS
ncbi:MAG: hypothetical protein M3332_17725 [Actinomycetota bacterium]|nr:hypothetical protein [Actinomycetota bacterium]